MAFPDTQVWMPTIKRCLETTDKVDFTDLDAALFTDSFDGDTSVVEGIGTVAGEVSGTGYTAGGVSLSGLSVSLNTGAGRGPHLVVTASASAEWSSSTLSSVMGVVYYDPVNTVNSVADPIVAVVKFADAPLSNGGGTFTAELAASPVADTVFALLNPTA